MGLASNSALLVAGFVMATILLWTIVDCVIRAGHVVVARSLVSILLSAIYITLRLSTHKTGDLLFTVTVLAFMLACIGTAELAAHLIKR